MSSTMWVDFGRSYLQPFTTLSLFLGGTYLALLWAQTDFASPSPLAPTTSYLGLPLPDRILSLYFPLLPELGASPLGTFLLQELIFSSLPLLLLFCLEPHRASSKGPLSLSPLFLLSSVVLGPAPVAYLLFLPALLFSSSLSASALPATVPLQHTHVATLFGFGFTLLTYVLLAALPLGATHAFVVFTSLLLFSPAAPAALLPLLRPEDEPLSPSLFASLRTRSCYLLAAGMAFGGHAFALARLLLAGPLSDQNADFFASLTSSLASLSPASLLAVPGSAYLLLTLAALFLFPLLLQRAEDMTEGLAPLVRHAWFSLLFSPGASIAMLLAHREDVISGLDDAVDLHDQ